MLESYLEHIRKYGEDNTTLERIDNEKGYIKENIKWATRKEQAENKRTTITFIAISPNNEKYICKNAEEFAQKFNLDRSGISKVIHKKRNNYKGWHFYKTSMKSVETIERIPDEETNLGIIE